MDPQQPLQLKDIHFPPSPDIWPLAIGWWILLTILLLLAVWLIFLIRKYLKIKKLQKMLLDELGQLENKLIHSPDKILISEINILLRRLALTYYPQVEVASLTGSDWLDFLDKSGGTKSFSSGAGKILAEAPYRSGQLENYNGDEFIPLIHNWVRKTTHAKANNRVICLKRQNDILAKKMGGCP